MLSLVVFAAVAATAPRLGVVVNGTNLNEAHALVHAVAPREYAVVPAAEMQQHIAAAASLGIACPKPVEAECIARVGAFAKIPFVLLIGGSTTSARAMVTLVDTATSVRKEASEALAPDPATHGDTLRALLGHVLLGAPLTSTIAIDVPGARIDVDGTPRGEGPLRVDVAPGPHTVRVSTSTEKHETQQVETFAGVTSTVRVELASGDRETNTLGGLRPLALGGFTVAGASALVATGTLLGAVLVTPDPANRRDYTAREFNDATSTGETLGVVATIAGVGALLGGAVGVVGLVVE